MRKPWRRWRAPIWSPVWLRRMFPGVWTQAEIDALMARARVRAAQIDWLSD